MLLVLDNKYYTPLWIIRLNKHLNDMYLSGFVLDFVYKIPGVFKVRVFKSQKLSFQGVFLIIFLCHTYSSVSVFSVLKKPTLIFLSTPCKLSACMDIFNFRF